MAEKQVEKTMAVVYDGVDGTVRKRFRTIEKAARYVRDRWEGAVCCGGPTNFHNDRGRFYLEGFSLLDIGRFTRDPSDGTVGIVFNK
jgi:hypothetical protein